MLKFTLADGPDGPSVEISIEEVDRIRRSLAGEHEPLAKTRIDGADAIYVQEAPRDVADAATAEYPKLARVTAPDGSHVWFKAKAAKGPLPVYEGTKYPGVNSSLLLAGRRQFVRETHQQVAEIIASDDGKVLPIPNNFLTGHSKDILTRIPGLQSPIEDWEAPEAYGAPPTS